MIAGRGRHLAFAVAMLALSSTDCGRKTAPKPPELIRPEKIRAVNVRNVEDGIEISWDRPRHYVDGARMYDLAGFRIERGSEGSEWTLVAEPSVDDRDRFRQIKNFKHVDTNVVETQVYRYRVRASTIDRD